MVHAPIVALDPDGICHASRRIEDDKDVGLNDLANKKRNLAFHGR
jgi:hypothetical protein